jgi:hypothetical protein
MIITRVGGQQLVKLAGPPLDDTTDGGAETGELDAAGRLSGLIRRQ